MLLCPCNSPGKNTGVGCCALFQGISWPRDQTHVSVSPALAGGFFTTSTTWEAAYCLLPVPNCLVPLPLEMCLLPVSRVPSPLWKDMWMLGTRSVLTAEVRIGEVTHTFSYSLHSYKAPKHPFYFLCLLHLSLSSSQLQWQEQVPWG